MSYMPKVLKTIERTARPDAAALRELAATADPSIPPAVMPTTGSEIVTVRLSTGLVDQLDAKADAEGTTRKVVITRALAAAGYRVPAHDLEDRTPRRRRRAA
jgi:hypothetical protein